MRPLRIPIVHARQVPITFEGRARYNVANALAAAVAAFAAGIDLDDIRGGLRTFHATPFQAPGRANVYELWRSDGTFRGTALVKDIYPGQRWSISTLEAAVLDRLLYFRADDGSGNQLWRSDGTAQGTWSLGAPLEQLNPSLAPLHGLLLFPAGGLPPARSRLWRTDGTLAGTALVRDVEPRHIVGFRGTAFFAGTEGVFNQRELWWTDGTPEGTVLFKEIREGAAESHPQGLSPYGAFLFFAADDGVHGQELWRSDGTLAGTVLVADINPGSASAFLGSYRTANLVYGLGDRIFFVATDGASGEELWAYRLPTPP